MLAEGLYVSGYMKVIRIISLKYFYTFGKTNKYAWEDVSRCMPQNIYLPKVFIWMI